MNEWDKTIEYAKSNIGRFDIKYKIDSNFQKFIAEFLFWIDWLGVWTTIYPKVWMPKELRNYVILQHEIVHLKDAESFFGLLPIKTKWFNVSLFYFCYFTPQIFSLLAFLAFINLWWLLCLVFLLPIPSPGRMISEVRAYRRSIELGGSIEKISSIFKSPMYFYMWPFKKHVNKMLLKASPYKEEMDLILREK